MEQGIVELGESRIKGLLVVATAELRDAILVVDRAGLQIALVIDKAGKLIGTLSDGDIRRALLKGISLSDSVETAMHSNPRVLEGKPSVAVAVEVMRKEKLRHVPVIGKSGRLCGLFVNYDYGPRPAALDSAMLIMAGGRGSRLGQITDSMPKPMVLIGEKPLLESIIERCISSGFQKFFISLGYRKSQIRDHFGDGSRWGIEISYLEETEPLGTAGALSLLPRDYDSSLVVTNGDVLSTVNYGKLLQFHKDRNAKVTVGVREHLSQIPFGVVETKGSSILRISEKPYYKHNVSAGMYVLEPEIFRRVSKASYVDMPDLIAEALREGEEVSAFPLHEDWIDVGTPEDLEGARKTWPHQISRSQREKDLD